MTDPLTPDGSIVGAVLPKAKLAAAVIFFSDLGEHPKPATREHLKTGHP